MRLTDFEQSMIKEIVFQLDPEAEIYLFGSRTDDLERGGHIDLLILSKSLGEKNRRQIRVDLQERIGEQKLGIIIANDLNKPFVRIAYNQGCRL